MPTAPACCRFVFEDGFGFEAWVALRARCADVFRLSRWGLYRRARPKSFRDFLDGKLPALPGAKPTLISDWADHLTTIFPGGTGEEIYRNARALMAGHGAGCVRLPALWVGL